MHPCELHIRGPRRPRNLGVASAYVCCVLSTHVNKSSVDGCHVEIARPFQCTLSDFEKACPFQNERISSRRCFADASRRREEQKESTNDPTSLRVEGTLQVRSHPCNVDAEWPFGRIRRNVNPKTRIRIERIGVAKNRIRHVRQTPLEELSEGGFLQSQASCPIMTPPGVAKRERTLFATRYGLSMWFLSPVSVPSECPTGVTLLRVVQVVARFSLIEPLSMRTLSPAYYGAECRPNS